MAFFRPHVFSPYAAQQQQTEPSFHGLFRLLEDWDDHHNTSTAQSQQPAKRPCQRAARRQQPVFTPKFDVQETESAYELHGELPGVQKQDINIEFSDPQTLVIRGRVERSSTTTQDGESTLLTSSTSASSEVGDDDEGVLVSHDEDTTTTTTTAAVNADAHSETASQRSFKATVEDDTDDQDAPVPSASASAVEKYTNTSDEQTGTNENGTTTAAAGAGSIDAEGAESQTQPAKPSAKFWISERSVGTFSRAFEFPERIEIDNVSASLENGVLSLTVPKAQKFGARQISVL